GRPERRGVGRVRQQGDRHPGLDGQAFLTQRGFTAIMSIRRRWTAKNRSTALADAPSDGRQTQPQAAEISAEEFEQVWAEARRVLGGPA
ncbi:hypothetical protein ACF06P_09120, partial [Streptomyces sp. NPDC015684]